ncbi:hypothetical protein SAMN02910265_01989 [Ruminococcus flavefaciens]|uniref:Uncharacterized protein n=1 Tax=Ruminococcus flavefaciens TaxID=1265 RepID=A0A1H6JTG8_RUMFL|nr:hypothetical protein [Ruminococcus flavefaciens]SEH65802.1 hypothetical protein SAMN02910265_01989 [Ruminococcus flavefaciens]
MKKEFLSLITSAASFIPAAAIMPLSGDNFKGMKTLTGETDSLGLKKRQERVFAADGPDEIAYSNMKPEMMDLKTHSNYFTNLISHRGSSYRFVPQGKHIGRDM